MTVNALVNALFKDSPGSGDTACAGLRDANLGTVHLHDSVARTLHRFASCALRPWIAEVIREAPEFTSAQATLF